MKVYKLVKKLQELEDQFADVVVDLHSEFNIFNIIQTITPIKAYENKGYVSKAYREEDKLKEKIYILIK